MGRRVEFDVDKTLHRAMKLFWLKGFEATSLQDIVDELEINRFSVYNTFGDKKGLFLKVLAHYRKTVLAFLLAPLKTDKPAKERLDDYFVLLLEQLESKSGGLGCLMQNTGLSQISDDPEVRDLLSLLVSDLQGAIAGAVLEIQRDHDTGMRVEDMAMFIVCQLQGMIAWRRATGVSEQLAGQISVLRKTVAAW